MLTQDQLAALGAYLSENTPGTHFLLLVAPDDAPTAIGVASSLPRELQVTFAGAFVQGCIGLETGNTFAVERDKTH